MDKLDNYDSSDRLALLQCKHRLIKHYNAVALQWLDKAIEQATKLKHQRKLLSQPVSLSIVK